jgi:hypothetical protein
MEGSIRTRIAVALKDFTVIPRPSNRDWDGALIHCWDGEKLVVGMVTQAALQVGFHLPVLPSRDACISLTQVNLALLELIIAEKYAGGNFSTIQEDDRQHPLIVVTSSDLDALAKPLIRHSQSPRSQ